MIKRYKKFNTEYGNRLNILKIKTQNLLCDDFDVSVVYKTIFFRFREELDLESTRSLSRKIDAKHLL